MLQIEDFDGRNSVTVDMKRYSISGVSSWLKSNKHGYHKIVHEEGWSKFVVITQSGIKFLKSVAPNNDDDDDEKSVISQKMVDCIDASRDMMHSLVVDKSISKTLTSADCDASNTNCDDKSISKTLTSADCDASNTNCDDKKNKANDDLEPHGGDIKVGDDAKPDDAAVPNVDRPGNDFVLVSKSFIDEVIENMATINERFTSICAGILHSESNFENITNKIDESGAVHVALMAKMESIDKKFATINAAQRLLNRDYCKKFCHLPNFNKFEELKSEDKKRLLSAIGTVELLNGDIKETKKLIDKSHSLTSSSKFNADCLHRAVEFQKPTFTKQVLAINEIRSDVQKSLNFLDKILSGAVKIN